MEKNRPMPSSATARLRYRFAAAALVFGGGFGAAGCAEEEAPPATVAPVPAAVALDPAALDAFPPLPPSFPGPGGPATAEQIELGRRLFGARALDEGGELSCASCHALDGPPSAGWPARPVGANGVAAPRNAQSLWNAGGRAYYGWDGRAEALEEFLTLHLLDPWVSDRGDPRALAEALAVPSVEEAATALAAYLRTLVRPGRWDRFRAGDTAALSVEEQRGFSDFVDAGCAMCHAGPLVGGDSLQLLGMIESWPELADPGRAAVTGDGGDEGIFVASSLRGVVATGPYGHAGQFPDLAEVVRLMAQVQLGTELDEAQVRSIVAWLGTL